MTRLQIIVPLFMNLKTKVDTSDRTPYTGSENFVVEFDGEQGIHESSKKQETEWNKISALRKFMHAYQLFLSNKSV